MNITPFGREELQALQPKWFEKAVLCCKDGQYTVSRSYGGIAQIREWLSPLLKRCGLTTYIVLHTDQRNILANKSIAATFSSDPKKIMANLERTYKDQKAWHAFLKQVGEGQGATFNPPFELGAFEYPDADIRRGHAQIFSLCERAVQTGSSAQVIDTVGQAVIAPPPVQPPAAVVPKVAVQTPPPAAVVPKVAVQAPSSHSKKLYDAVRGLGLEQGKSRGFGTKIPKVGCTHTGIYVEVYDKRSKPVHIFIQHNGTVERFDGFFKAGGASNGLTNHQTMDPNDPLLAWIDKQISGSPAPSAGATGSRPLALQHPTKGPYVPFYKTGESSFLGNFDECPQGVTIDGMRYRNSEAAFQCAKFLQMLATSPIVLKQGGQLPKNVDPEVLKRAFAACTGEQAFDLKKFLEGADRSRTFAVGGVVLDARYSGAFNNLAPQGWTSGGRDRAMWGILQAKFSQNPTLMQRLQSTQHAYLLEHNQVRGRDEYWSDNNDGTGCNMLGRMLMCIRDGQPQPPPGAPTNAETVKITDFAKHFKPQSYPIF